MCYVQYRTLLSCGEYLVVSSHAETVPHIRLVNPRQRLLEPILTDLDLLDPRLDALVRRELQHLDGFPPGAQVRRADEDAVAEQVLVADLHALALGQTDGDKLAVHVQQAQVGAKVPTLEAAGRVEDDVKGHGVRLVPALLRRGQEAVGAHGLAVGLLGAAARDGPDLGAQGLGEEQPKVSDSSHAEDADLLAGTDAVAHKWAVGRQTGAEHRGSDGAG